MTGYPIAYAIVSFIVLFVGSVILSNPQSNLEKRTSAKVMLTCWLWPIWLVILVVVGIRYLMEIAWGDDS